MGFSRGGGGRRQDEKKLGAHRNAKEVTLFLFFSLLASRFGVGSSQLRHFINSCYLTSGIVVGLLRPPSHWNQQQRHQ